MRTSFCLLVQHASAEHLCIVFDVLLGTLAPWAPGSATGPKKRAKKTDNIGTDPAAAAAMQEEEEDLSEEGGGGRSARPQEEHYPRAGVLLLELAVRAGQGPAFATVVQDRVLLILAALCGRLREATSPTALQGGRKLGGGISGAGLQAGLQLATESLRALEGLLCAQPYQTVTTRVVSLVLGSIEPVTRLIHGASTSLGAFSPMHTSAATEQRRGGGEAVGLAVAASCFEACCRLLGTVLQHYARRVYSCTPPFISLCRSLLQAFYCMASADEPRHHPPRHPHHHQEGRIGGEVSGNNPHVQGQGQGQGQGLGLERQVAVAAALSRVFEYFVAHKEILRRYAPFVLAEYVSLAGVLSLEPAARSALLAGIFPLVDVCSAKETQQLHGLLDPTGKAVFRSLYDDYQRQYKFVGKV
ncbi:unnamed protein product [Discosporangium mesarthrocarpum]